MPKDIEFRCDDVLQYDSWGRTQRWLFSKKDPFECFKEVDKIFKKYNFPCILAIVAQGIDMYPEWVQYIKDNQHRYKIELHGYFHHNRRVLQKMGEERLYRELLAGIKRIKETFGMNVTTFYVPFGKEGLGPNTEKVCRRLGIKCMAPHKNDSDIWLWLWRSHRGRLSSFSHVNFHFWHKRQVEATEEILKIIHET